MTAPTNQVFEKNCRVNDFASWKEASASLRMLEIGRSSHQPKRNSKKRTKFSNSKFQLLVNGIWIPERRRSLTSETEGSVTHCQLSIAFRMVQDNTIAAIN
jgi:hypothetical protein